jgi:mannose-6-phosphate isomerase class I
LVTVIEGEISMNGTLLKKGDHCIVTSQIHSIEITGHGWLIMAEAK